MTIETIATQKVSQRRDSNSSNGYQESHSEDDGYFTSAVSVQHKVKCVLVHIKRITQPPQVSFSTFSFVVKSELLKQSNRAKSLRFRKFST